jgi:chemotaxis protein methyltransferase CheR
MRELGIPGEGEYRWYLEEYPDEWETVDGFCRITISRFLRDRGVMLLLQRQVLPELAEGALGRGQGALRCWSAGCGSGEEPYTLSLLWRLEPFEEPAEPLALRFPGLSFQVTATDAESKVLERARQAVYPRGALKELPALWVQAAFEETASGLSLRPPSREGVDFSLGDVRDVADPRRYHLILCRNLAFTYYEEGLQGEILKRLLPSLEPGGYLVLGGHERLPTGSWPLEAKHSGSPVYRKVEGE